MSDGEDSTPYIKMLEGHYEEALRLFIERTRNGKPVIGYTKVRPHYVAIRSLPEYSTLQSLTEQWRKEQRALYDELTAARVSAADTAHP